MTIAALNDTPLLASAPVRWALRDGVQPVVEEFHITPAGRAALEGLGNGPVTLRLEIGPRGNSVEFRNLVILGFPPGPNPHIHSVMVADRRWFWPFAHVLRRYNVRRRVGVKRVLLTNVEAPAQLQPRTADLRYRRWSLQDPNRGFAGRWRGTAPLIDVFNVVLDKESETRGVRAPLVVKDLPGEVPFENFVVDDDGMNAANRILTHYPEARVFVDPAGRVVVYSASSGEEVDTVSELGAEIVGQGHIDFVPMRNQRPRKVRVHFTPEFEIKCDYRSRGVALHGSVTSTTIVNPPPLPPNVAPQFPGGTGFMMKNVMPLPDHTLTVRGQEVTQGTYVEIDEHLMRAWGAPPGFSKAIDDQIIRREWVPFIDSIFARLLRFGRLDPTADWESRIGALKQHFRKTFQIHENYMERILRLKAERLGNINVATGQRAPAIAYGDWAYVPAMKYFFVGNRRETAYVVNASSYKENRFVLDKDSKVMPVGVTVVDEEQGIVAIDFRSDPYNQIAEYIPGRIDNVPQGDTTDRNANKAFNARSQRNRHRPVQLAGDWKLSIMLTMIPASPNSKEQLHTIEIEPRQVASMLPPSARRGLADAAGPPMDVRIGPGVETARFAWSEKLAPEIIRALGFGEAGIRQESIETLLLNTASDPRTGASLQRIALAEAARIYGSYNDRMQGNASGDLKAGIEPSGSLSEVIFELDRRGVATCQVSLPERFEPMSFFSLLDASTRSIVLQLAVHEAGP